MQGSTGENLLAIGSSNEEGSTVAEEHLQFFAIEDGELTGGEDSAHNSSDLESNTELQRELLSTRSDDDQLRLIVTATQHESQEQVNRLEVELQEMKKENLIHQVEFGRRSFLEDKQKRSEKIFRTSREYFLKKNRKDSAASHLEEYFSIGAGLLHVLEPSKYNLAPFECYSDINCNVKKDYRKDSQISHTFLPKIGIQNQWSDLSARPSILCPVFHCVVPENIHTPHPRRVFGLHPHPPGISVPRAP